MAAQSGLADSEIPQRGSGRSLAGLDPIERSFVLFFAQSGGSVCPSIFLTRLPHQGRCYVANDDIDEDTDLFIIPRSSLLNTRNSLLPELCAAYEAEHAMTPAGSSRAENDMSLDDACTDEKADTGGPRTFQELSGWSPLILCMMWESWRSREQSGGMSPGNGDTLEGDGEVQWHGVARPRGQQEWKAYLEIMPKDFSHMPMFWSEKELKELRGTSVTERIGREEADREYHTNVRPFILNHAPVFLGAEEAPQIRSNLLENYYSLQEFHIQGSRILSRSFYVKEDVPDGVAVGESSFGPDVDASEDVSEDGGDDDDAANEREDVADIAMIPMADILNASFASENARLFYSSSSLIMRANRRIQRGEQILNTYADPPNADLLRRYGYVEEWNGSDEVELNASFLVEAALQSEVDRPCGSPLSKRQLRERIEYLVSQGLEESFALTYAFPPDEHPPYRPQPLEPTLKEIQQAISNFDEELLTAARTLLLSEENFRKHQNKEKVPKARLDEQISALLLKALHLRLSIYAGGASTRTDEELLYGPLSSLAKGTKLWKAVVVRLGEKRVLENNIMVLDRLIQFKASESAGNTSKRKIGQSDSGKLSQAKKSRK